jgi:adenylylsulfate kinase-like enzyme
VVQTRSVVVVITGPIASGKSTVAKELARVLGRAEVPAEIIDLDLVHDRLPPNGTKSEASTWALARRETATVANILLDAGVAVVIADGSFNVPSDRAALTRHVRPSSRLIFVTLQVSFEEALRRAQGDSTRGRSRDRQFLESHFAARHDVFQAVPATDIVIDTERTTATAAAAAIARLVGSARI